MSRLTPLPARKVVRVLLHLGFVRDHQRGSHLILRHPDGRVISIPVHPREEIKRGTLKAIIEVSGLSVGEFMDLA